MGARVVIAGGGIAGVEAALGLGELAPGGVEVVVVSPAQELLHQALSDQPTSLGGVARHPLDRVCAALGAELVRDAVTAVDPGARRLLLREHEALDYDALIVAVGARRGMSLDHAVLFGSSLDVPAVEDVLSLVRDGHARRLAVVVPPGVAWSLPAYEVAMRAAGDGGEALVIVPEERPGEVFGAAAGAVGDALDAAGVTVVHGRAVDIEPDCVLLDDGRRLPADAIVALPWTRGPWLDGLPHDDAGFVPIDPFGAVDGMDGVFGAGDGTTFPIRQGGLACQQAAVAATSIAHLLGAALAPQALHPIVRGALATGDGPLYLEHDLTTGVARASREPLWHPPHRVAGIRLPAFLERLAAA